MPSGRTMPSTYDEKRKRKKEKKEKKMKKDEKREKGIARNDDRRRHRSRRVMRERVIALRWLSRLRLIQARLIAVKTAQKRSKPWNVPLAREFTTGHSARVGFSRRVVGCAPRFLRDQRGVLASYPRAGE